MWAVMIAGARLGATRPTVPRRIAANVLGDLIKIPRLGLAFASSAAGKLLGFFRIQAIAIALGATLAADALLLSFTVLTLFDIVFISGAAILTSQAIFVRRHTGRGGRMALAGLARSAAMWTWLGLVFGGLCAVAGDPLARLIAPGFSAEGRAIFASCCMLAGLLPAASTLMVFASALNRINGREVLFTVNPVVINGVSWLAIWVAGATGGSAMTIVRAFFLTLIVATLLMFGYQLIAMDPASRRIFLAHLARGLVPRQLVRRARLHRRELQLVAPIVGALLIQQVVTLISYSFATRAGSGFLLLFGLAERLINVVFAVSIMTFLTVLEPRWARAAVVPGGSREIADDVTVICAALIPLTVTLMFAGDSLALILFGHGAVGTQELTQLAEIVRIYALSLPGLSLGVVFSRLLVIRNRGGSIFLVNGIVTVLHLLICTALFRVWSATGVAAALVLTFSIQAACYAGFLAGSGGGAANGFGGTLARLLGLGVVVVCAAWGVAQLSLPSYARLALVGVTALAVTAACAPLLGLRLLSSVKRLAQL